MIGNYNTMVQGRKSWRGWIEWWPATAIVWLWGTLSPGRRVMGYRVQKLRIPHQDWFREDFRALLELLREGKIHPVVAERLPLSEARRAHEMLETRRRRGNSARTVGQQARSPIARGATGPPAGGGAHTGAPCKNGTQDPLRRVAVPNRGVGAATV